MSPAIAEHYAGEPHGEYKNVYIPLLVGLGVMGVAFLISLALFYMDMESDRRERKHHETQILSQRQPSIKPISTRPKKRLSSSTVSKASKSG